MEFSGNPFPSYINIASLLTNNASQIEDAKEAVYVYSNGAGYTPQTTGYIHPGQGFFISREQAGALNFDTSILSHQTGVTFYKNNDTQIILNLSDGKKSKFTTISYIDGKTTGLDPRFDLGAFTGQANDLNIYTHLVSDSEGTNFFKQSLPIDNLEELVVPVGVKAEAGREVTFTANINNLASGMHVFLENRTSGEFTKLDGGAKYTLTLTEAVNGIGTFYLHTKSSALSTVNEILDTVSIYATDKNTLKVVGAQGLQTVKVYSILGKQVVSKSFNSDGVSDVSLPNLSLGVYIVQLSNDKGTTSKKIILE